jgi:hypothetical protein
MTFNKEVCRLCLKDKFSVIHILERNNAIVFAISEQEWEERFNKQTHIICPELNGITYFNSITEPFNCPYMTEHVISKDQ